jgi:hypothetical protein
MSGVYKKPWPQVGRLSVRFEFSRFTQSSLEQVTLSLLRELIKFRVKSFRAGPYGGREAQSGDPITWPNILGRGLWQGQTAVHAIFLPNASLEENVPRLHRAISKHLDAWRSARSMSMSKSAGHISNLIYVTNVSLGQHGQTEPSLEKLLFQGGRDLGFESWKVWGNSTLSAMLETSPNTRKQYAPYLVAERDIASLEEYRIGVANELSQALCEHAEMDLLSDQWVRLSAVENSPQDKLSLGDVAIDLPLVGKGEAARSIIEAANSPKSIDDPSSRRFLLEGGPGQGKTTIGQLICQAFRLAYLGASERPDTEAARTRSTMRQALDRNRLPVPTFRRWPIRIDLSEFADAASGPNGPSLIRFIADEISSRVDVRVDAARIRTWLETWPWLLILDGLDEVSSASARDLLMQRINDFLATTENLRADVTILVTTRPQGYAGEFDGTRFTTLSLAPLNPRQAVRYAMRLSQVKHNNDRELRDKVIMRVKRAAEEAFSARLMRTPLQVTIMSILLEGRERVPQARYGLFAAYYDTIYAREVSKKGPMSDFLDKRKNDMNFIHERLGLLLQVSSESIGGADASLGRETLKQIVVQRLKSEGNSKKQADQLAHDLIKAVLQRLVLIVPKGLDDVGFEIRSIQEFMAARAIVTGKDEPVLQRMRLTLRSAHWRNTWLFAAGRIAQDREDIRGDLAQVLAEADTQDLPSVVIAPGADLALDLLEDDLAPTALNFLRNLARQALALLDLPPDRDLQRRASALLRLSLRDEVACAMIKQKIESSGTQSSWKGTSAYLLVDALSMDKGKLGIWASTLRRQFERSRKSAQSEMLSILKGPPRSIKDHVSAALRETEYLQLTAMPRTFVTSLAGVTPRQPYPWHRADANALLAKIGLDGLQSHFKDPDVTTAIAYAAFQANPDRAGHAIELRNVLISWSKRLSVGEDLLEITPPPPIDSVQST